jgi:tRNA(Ile)-lysidine synthetase-like protein
MNDVAETFIMRLARASGAAGLAGLKPVSQVNVITFIRPLLNIDSSSIRAFLKSRGISWREDSTNSDISIPRNKVRHVIMPFLRRELDPKIVEHICRSASYLRECAEEQCSATPPVPAASAVARAPEKASPAVKRKYNLNIRRATGFEKTTENIGMLPAKAWMSEASLKGRTLEVRTWRDGDWMRPCGFPHRKKLQDIFVTSKTPPEIRRALPVVADSGSGEILWIPGYRVSDSVKVESAKSPSVELSLSAE